MKPVSWAAKPLRFEVQDADFTKSSDTPPIYFAKCVEVARTPQGVAVRDTKDESKTTLFYTHDEWSAFVSGVKKGEFDV